jgi:hypothetical protein
VLASTGDKTFTTTGTTNGSCAIAMAPANGTGFGPAHIQSVQPLTPASPLANMLTPPPPEPPINPPVPIESTVPPPFIPPVIPPVTDRITHLTVPSHSVDAGRSLPFDVTLAAAGKVTVDVIRHVPASGHGKHRRKAHDVDEGTATFAGVVGVNKLKLLKVRGHTLPAGSYAAKVTAGGRTHTFTFTLKH